MLSDPFNLYYVKGKDLILADFLSRIRSDRSDPNEVIPISFVDMKARLRHSTLHFHGRVTRSTTKREGLVMRSIHGSDKLLDPHRKPEHQTDLTLKTMPSAPPIQVQRPFKWTVIPPSATQVMSRKLINRSVKILCGKRDHQPQVKSQIPLKLPRMDPLTPKEPSPPQITNLTPVISLNPLNSIRKSCTSLKTSINQGLFINPPPMCLLRVNNYHPCPWIQTLIQVTLLLITMTLSMLWFDVLIMMSWNPQSHCHALQTCPKLPNVDYLSNLN